MFNQSNVHSLPTERSKRLIEEISKKIGFDSYAIKVNDGVPKGENFLGEIYRVKIVGTRQGQDLTKQLILKMISRDESFRKNVPLDLYFVRENAAYSTVLPLLDKQQEKLPVERKFRFPIFYAGACDNEDGLVIMDDLSVEGYRMFDRIKSMDLEHAMISIRILAGLHATSFAMKYKEPKLFKELSNNVSHAMEYGVHYPKFIRKNKNLILEEFKGTEYHDRLRDYLQDMQAKMEHLLDPATCEPYNVICHGDCWTSNILFRYENGRAAEARLVDWQIIRLASPIVDLGYLLFTSVDEHFRGLHFHQMINEYYEYLKENLALMGCDISVCYPREVYDKHLKEVLPFGMMLAIVMCPITLCDRNECPSLVEQNEEFGESDDTGSKLAMTPRERLMGGVRDFFKFNLYP